MNFNNATFDNKKNPKLVNEDAFSYEIKPEASDISNEMILDEAWNLLDDLINTGEYFEVLSDYEIESQTTIEYKDKNNKNLLNKLSIVRLYDEKDKKFARRYSNRSEKIDEEEHRVAFDYNDEEIYTLPIVLGYLQIDGKFYDPEEINNFIAENWNSK